VEDSIPNFNNQATLGVMPSHPVTEHPTPLSTVLLLPSRHTVVADGAGLDNNSFPLKG
jgi:hypothetical protein